MMWFFDMLLVGNYSFLSSVFYSKDETYLGVGAREHSLFLTSFPNILLALAGLNLISKTFFEEWKNDSVGYIVVTVILIFFFVVYIVKGRMDVVLSNVYSIKHRVIYSVISFLYFGLAFWLFIVS